MQTSSRTDGLYGVYRKNIRDEGYLIALISDLHFGTTMDADRLAEHCRRIEAQQPDLIVLCGDIVDEATSLSEMRSAARILGGMSSGLGVFYVYGNHDRAWYSRNADFTAQELDFDLQLSGHTHGGQIWPVGVVSDILGFGELNYGYERIDDFQVIVSSGIAGWGYAVRTGSWSEFVMVDVQRK